MIFRLSALTVFCAEHVKHSCDILVITLSWIIEKIFMLKFVERYLKQFTEDSALLLKYSQVSHWQIVHDERTLWEFTSHCQKFLYVVNLEFRETSRNECIRISCSSFIYCDLILCMLVLLICAICDSLFSQSSSLLSSDTLIWDLLQLNLCVYL